MRGVPELSTRIDCGAATGSGRPHLGRGMHLRCRSACARDAECQVSSLVETEPSPDAVGALELVLSEGLPEPHAVVFPQLALQTPHISN
jgi:hypothetical protein